jgi:membrane protein
MNRPWIVRTVAWMRGLLGRLISLEIVDRSLVIGAQAFSALIPLLIVLASWTSKDGRTFADSIIRKFELSGDSADAVRRTFAAPADGDTVTVVGVLLVVFSALAFTRALQRTFELTWNLPRRGIKSTGWGLLWLAAFAACLTLFPALKGIFGDAGSLAVSLAGGFVLWLMTPYLLLARRIPWRLLIAQAGLSAVGMTILSGGLIVYVPRAMSKSADEFGAIGVAFTLLTALWAAGFVLVTAAAVGAYVVEPRWPATRAIGEGRSLNL